MYVHINVHPCVYIYMICMCKSTVWYTIDCSTWNQETGDRRPGMPAQVEAILELTMLCCLRTKEITGESDWVESKSSSDPTKAGLMSPKEWFWRKFLGNNKSCIDCNPLVTLQICNEVHGFLENFHVCQLDASCPGYPINMMTMGLNPPAGTANDI